MNFNLKKWSLRAALLVAGGFGLAACEQAFKLIAPNEFGMILTPTGFQNDILKPGSVDIGREVNGKGNKLYLVDGSLIGVKEAFSGPQASADGEDHRCSMRGAQPLTLDVRFTFAIPDVETPEGAKDLARLMTLSKATAVDGNRVFRIDPQSVYDNQAKQEVRGKIRQLCASFEDFAAAEAAFSDEGENGMTARIERLVQEVLKKNGVPLRLISAQASNMKPDQSIIDANAAINAAQARVDAVEKVVEYLGDDPTGRRWDVYRLQMIQEIAKTGDVMLLDLNSGNSNNILPVPMPRPTEAPANDNVAPAVPEETTGTDN